MGRRDAESAEQRQFKEPPVELNRWTDAIIGAAIEVHRHLGPGFLESVYERAIVAELQLRRVPVRSQVLFNISYKDLIVGEHRVDLIVGEQVIVELKAIDSLSSIHRAQVLSYLHATGMELGLLINFNVPVLSQGVRRVVASR